MDRAVGLELAFDGTDFHGWQKQPGLRTVQGVLEEAIARTVRHPIDLVGCGRTDAGVHAVGYVCDFSTRSDLPPDRLLHAITSRLPEDVGPRALFDVHPDFHATRSATSKQYRYRIYHAVHRPVCRLAQRYSYHYWHALDPARMQSGGTLFEGTHDFTAMTPTGTVRESMVRTVQRCAVNRAGDEIVVEVEGQGFLHHQVRNMVGTLIEIGRGRWEPESVAEILDSGDRRRGGPTAPARGLTLQWVRYPVEWLQAPGGARTDHVTASPNPPFEMAIGETRYPVATP